MSTMWTLILMIATFCMLATATAIAPQNPELDESYSFEKFVADFRKSYESDQERSRRKEIFRHKLRTILEHNRDGTSNYVLGVNYFTDMLPEEVPTGYAKSLSSRRRHTSSATSEVARKLQVQLLEGASNLPDFVDWRKQGAVTPVKAQGKCGSCWAFATTEAIESHIALTNGLLFSLSPQELVSCAPNQLDCGGTGGCGGSTAELAYEYVVARGIVEEWLFGYESYYDTHSPVNCTYSSQSQPAVGISGYLALPTNGYNALMNAVAKLGPVVVAVACHDWIHYHSGIYDDPNRSRPSATNLNHFVVVDGYGTDKETGEDYWLVRNSWGPTWGENGYIRLKRVDPYTLDNPDSDCGMDITPENGVACTKDKSGQNVTPPAEKVCGTSGILYDATIPVGGHLL